VFDGGQRSHYVAPEFDLRPAVSSSTGFYDLFDLRKFSTDEGLALLLDKTALKKRLVELKLPTLSPIFSTSTPDLPWKQLGNLRQYAVKAAHKHHGGLGVLLMSDGRDLLTGRQMDADEVASWAAEAFKREELPSAPRCWEDCTGTGECEVRCVTNAPAADDKVQQGLLVEELAVTWDGRSGLLPDEAFCFVAWGRLLFFGVMAAGGTWLNYFASDGTPIFARPMKAKKRIEAAGAFRTALPWPSALRVAVTSLAEAAAQALGADFIRIDIFPNGGKPLISEVDAWLLEMLRDQWISGYASSAAIDCRQQLPRMYSAEKLEDPRKTRRSRLEPPAMPAIIGSPSLGEEMYSMPTEERLAAVKKFVKSTGPEGFPPKCLTNQSAITLAEELMVMAAMLVCMGGPLFMFIFGAAAMYLGSWRDKAAYVLLAAILAGHPLPGAGSKFSQTLMKSRLTGWMNKYFSYRILWCDDDVEIARQRMPWIGVGPPHGVLPFANMLSIPILNNFLGCPFVGAAANVVFKTPGLRYLMAYGCVTADRKDMTKALSRGQCVGILPDGVAGIFRTNTKRELVAMKDRKGLARLALRTGTPLIPVYSFGNTAAFSCWYDRWGILEAISRKVQASFFLYWGRCFLPIPYRVQITMAIGKLIEVPKVDNPTHEQIDELHQRIMEGIQTTFDRHKHCIGWGDKELEFV
ncbi:DGAT2, partial [Symbiodinium pilosum]